MTIKPSGAVNQFENLFSRNSKASAPDKGVRDTVSPRQARTEKSVTSSHVSEFKLELFDTSNSNFSTQSGLYHLINNPDFDISSLSHDGQSILDLSPSEAADLVSEEGFYGVKNTAERLSGFVINGGGDDLEKVKAGREGIARGFKEAEQLWGGKLPDISYETLDLALQQIDARIQELGGSVINAEV